VVPILCGAVPFPKSSRAAAAAASNRGDPASAVGQPNAIVFIGNWGWSNWKTAA